MSYPGLSNRGEYITIFVFVLSILMIIFAGKISKRRKNEIRGVGIALLILSIIFFILYFYMMVF